MNKQYYSFGNPLKIKLREHYCYKCGTKLTIIKHHKVVSQKSEEAKYYDFSVGMDGGIMIGACEFIHKVFYCYKCSQNIECVTQINQEDIDILIDKVKKHFHNKGRKIVIIKQYEDTNGIVLDRISKIEQIKKILFTIEESEKEPLIYEIPICRKTQWERPYYFKIRKKQIIDFINRSAK